MSSRPPAATPRFPKAIEDAAAGWVACRNAGLSQVETLEFARWLKTDPLHAEAFASFEAVWTTVNRPRLSGETGYIRAGLEARRRRRSRRRVLFAGAGAAVVGCLLLARGWLPPRDAGPASGPNLSPPATVAIHPDARKLPDGSVVELNSGADIEVAFTAGIRAVRLLHGEALFEVAKDRVHPFVVTAGGVEVRAVGTAFSIKCGQERIGVLVTEGRVAVETAPAAVEPSATAARPPIFVTAGNSIDVPARGTPGFRLEIKPAVPEEIAAALAWRGKRIEFTDTSLAEAVAIFNRQNRVQLSVSDPGLKQLKLNGIFWADDPEAFARLLEVGSEMKAERVGDRIVLGAR